MSAGDYIAVEAHEAAEQREAAREAERAHRELTAAFVRERELEAAEPDQTPLDYARAESVTLH